MHTNNQHRQSRKDADYRYQVASPASKVSVGSYAEHVQ
ncbi:hypothetical protein AN901_201443 [Pseudomonas syringae pv. theae]|nr:hypothetical protein AN901_201443 [Pseudomonas syringae pv. theae]